MLPASTPSRQFLPWIATAAKVLLVLLLSGWFLLALGWALLHGAIVPRIDEWRPQLQNLAQKATGLQVEIGQISARSTGLFPSFELRQVRVLDAAGHPALQLPEVLVVLSPQSTLRLELEQLVVRGAELDVRRSADGRLWLAGVPISPEAGVQDNALADWLLAQPEWAFQGGTLRWRDERENVDLVLTEVDAVMRNPGQSHHFRIDATPPAEWGERMSLRGLFRQPLLSRSASDWRQWSGQLYGQFSRIDLLPWQPYVQAHGLTLTQGRGALRAWVDLAQGRLTQASADVALDDVQARLAPQLAPLSLARLTGRLIWKDHSGRDLHLQAQSLSFDTTDGLHWPGGNVALQMGLDAQGQSERGQFKADRLDLQALARIAQRLPLDAHWQAQLRALAPQGIVEKLDANWQGPLQAPVQATARGRIRDLVLAAGSGPHHMGPGVSGLGLDFELQRQAGQDKAQASFTLQRGWLEWPGLFQEPRIALDKLSGELRLQRDAQGLSVEIRQGQLLGDDAQGEFRGTWKQAAAGDALGSLDLQGQLSRADASRVWRYLPQALSEDLRGYVRDAVSQGRLSEVRFKVKGPLASFPFAQGGGDFQISGKLRNGSYTLVPPRLQQAGSKPWPTLAQMDAELLLQRDSLLIHKAQARVAGQAAVQLGKGEARIALLGRQSVVEVSSQIKGPLAQALEVVNQSPLSAITGQALARTTATGSTEVQLKLSLPLQDLARAKVQGSVALPGNDVQFAPEVPPMGRLRGSLSFSESGFQVSGAQARMLGGDLRFDGGLRSVRPGETEVQFQGQGTASVEGLEQWRDIADLSPLLKQASGSTAYSASVGFRQGALELSIESNLSGLALALPEPLGKPAAASLPLRIDKAVLGESTAGRQLQDRLSVSLGAGTPQAVSASFLRDISGAQARVLGGQILIGGEAEATASEREVRLSVQLPRLNLDPWTALLPSAVSDNSSSAGGVGYLPTVLNLRTGSLKVQGHEFRDVVLGGRREAGAWKATLSSSELRGHGEYRPSGALPGRLYARLSHLSLGTSAAQEVEALLDSQPSSIPALDIVVDELELRGKKLGRLEVEAINRNPTERETQREWRLSKLRLSVPEATLSATGSWAALPASPLKRGTQLNFRLDVSDSGELLKRLGLDGALRRGKGRLEGQLGWTGSPLSLHHPSLGGQMVVDMEAGQFLKAEPGAAKLLGVLNLQALPRRLTLDFRDVFSEGFAFDWVRGHVAIAQGVASTQDLRMKGVSAAVMMDGSADIARETQNLRVVVVPEINAGTASLLAATINPAMALGTFVAQWLLRQPLNQASTQEFQITGPWRDPQIQKVSRPSAQIEGGSTQEGKP
jgi:uncharacterized protein (TIGR02099 family)